MLLHNCDCYYHISHLHCLDCEVNEVEKPLSGFTARQGNNFMREQKNECNIPLLKHARQEC